MLSLSPSLPRLPTWRGSLADWLYLPGHKLVKRTRRMRNASSYAKLLLQQRTSEMVGEGSQSERGCGLPYDAHCVLISSSSYNDNDDVYGLFLLLLP